MQGVVKSAEKAAATERELNEFLAHEVRNPLSAAMSALSFVTSAVNETAHISNEEFKKALQEDAEIIGSSLHFIDEFLRSMLDTCCGQQARNQVGSDGSVERCLRTSV
jgi:signal transduction histidine kinase